jgi:hypothetical protein
LENRGHANSINLCELLSTCGWLLGAVASCRTQQLLQRSLASAPATSAQQQQPRQTQQQAHPQTRPLAVVLLLLPALLPQQALLLALPRLVVSLCGLALC